MKHLRLSLSLRSLEEYLRGRQHERDIVDFTFHGLDRASYLERNSDVLAVGSDVVENVVACVVRLNDN